MSQCEATNDLVTLTAMRSALSHALECLDRLSHPNDELEKSIEFALNLSARKERECVLMRRLSHYRAGLRAAEAANSNRTAVTVRPYEIIREDEQQ